LTWSVLACFAAVITSHSTHCSVPFIASYIFVLSGKPDAVNLTHQFLAASGEQPVLCRFIAPSDLTAFASQWRSGWLTKQLSLKEL
jgi:hypothetical protein